MVFERRELTFTTIAGLVCHHVAAYRFLAFVGRVDNILTILLPKEHFRPLTALRNARSAAFPHNLFKTMLTTK